MKKHKNKAIYIYIYIYIYICLCVCVCVCVLYDRWIPKSKHALKDFKALKQRLKPECCKDIFYHSLLVVHIAVYSSYEFLVGNCSKINLLGFNINSSNSSSRDVTLRYKLYELRPIKFKFKNSFIVHTASLIKNKYNKLIKVLLLLLLVKANIKTKYSDAKWVNNF